MTALLTEKLKTLSGVLADLRDRVRVALASEVARAVSAAVREVVQAVLAGGRPDPVRRSSTTRTAGRRTARGGPRTATRGTTTGTSGPRTATSTATDPDRLRGRRPSPTTPSRRAGRR